MVAPPLMKLASPTKMEDDASKQPTKQAQMSPFRFGKKFEKERVQLNMEGPLSEEQKPAIKGDVPLRAVSSLREEHAARGRAQQQASRGPLRAKAVEQRARREGKHVQQGRGQRKHSGERGELLGTGGAAGAG